MLREAIESHLEFMASDGDPMPRPVTTTFDFSLDDDPNGEVDHYVVEWMTINVPVSKSTRHAMSA